MTSSASTLSPLGASAAHSWSPVSAAASSAASRSPEPLASRLAKKLGLAHTSVGKTDVVTLVVTSDGDGDGDDDDEDNDERTGSYHAANVSEQSAPARHAGKSATVRCSDDDSSDSDGGLLRVDMPRTSASFAASAFDVRAADAAAAALAARRAGKRPAVSRHDDATCDGLLHDKQHQKEEAARVRAEEKARKEADKQREKAVREVVRRVSKKKTTSERMEDLTLTATTQVHATLIKADALIKLHEASVDVHTADPPNDALGRAVEHVRWRLRTLCTAPEQVGDHTLPCFNAKNCVSNS
jgi:hypothetical protein